MKKKHLILLVVLLIILTFSLFQIYYKIIEHYENKEEDAYIKSLFNEIKLIDNDIEKIEHKLRFFEGSKSYTIDKKDIYICKKDKKTGEIYHKNQLVLVLIHEISHALCPDVGHTPSFDYIFENLLQKATDANLYTPTISVDNYCE